MKSLSIRGKFPSTRTHRAHKGTPHCLNQVALSSSGNWTGEVNEQLPLGGLLILISKGSRTSSEDLHRMSFLVGFSPTPSIQVADYLLIYLPFPPITKLSCSTFTNSLFSFIWNIPLLSIYYYNSWKTDSHHLLSSRFSKHRYCALSFVGWSTGNVVKIYGNLIRGWQYGFGTFTVL